ncbi:patatin-like phospholipase family protein [Numidum massiliense]|uniref:patatin-like phospholipase family protein n=1 Tax=Numidum massiliense TaxID=1522315 RepID=UPI0006D59297|nr:patatin-like phospholipase family protein [Numidum massiliense]
MWADAVFEGGGVKAIGLVGALTVAEQQGYRWKRLAGTSAGAIIAALLAAGYKASELTNIMGKVNYASFVRPTWWHRLPLVGPTIRLWVKRGLHPGKSIECWIESLLRKKGVRTFADLADDKLYIVASDITRGRLLVLPRDLEQYGLKPRDVTVAKAVLMSCSIPFFFDPVLLHSRTEPQVNVIVDGSVLSNFPVWLFDKQSPRWPTLGFRLVAKTSAAPRRIGGPLSLFLALFQTMMDAHDTRHMEEQDRVRTILVPSQGVKTTDFHISPQKSEALYTKGVDAAEQFFKNWDFPQYVRTFRQSMAVNIRTQL